MTVRVVYGTETGTAAGCAQDLGAHLQRNGWAATVTDMADYPHDVLPDEDLFVVITSTFGNGQAPSNAENLLAHLVDDAPALTGLKYAVLALGDRAHPKFCQCGKDFDAALEKLGGVPVIPRVECDGDVDVPFGKFQTALVDYLAGDPAAFPRDESLASSSGGGEGFFAKLLAFFGFGGSTPPAPVAPVEAKPKADLAILKATRLLSGKGSSKETRHYVFDLGREHGLVPGDCVGIHARNAPALVAAVLEAAGMPGTRKVTWQGARTTLEEVLATADLQKVTRKLLETLDGGEAFAVLAGGDEEVKAYAAKRHLLHVLREHEVEMSPQELVDTLSKLGPRLYSVADAGGGTSVDLCVETLRYTFEGVETVGVASGYLADDISVGDGVEWYGRPNKAFHLPGGDAPLLFIGAGTGIAPFRGFLQELKGSGRETWMFFGHRNEATDKLYGAELDGFVEDGTLGRVTYAWSRDQEERVYVQDRVRESAEDVWAAIERGAVVMVCGGLDMAAGVREALSAIASDNGQDADWLERLTEEGRFLQDAY